MFVDPEIKWSRSKIVKCKNTIITIIKGKIKWNEKRRFKVELLIIKNRKNGEEGLYSKSPTIRRRIDISLEDCSIEIRANWREICLSKRRRANCFTFCVRFCFFSTPSIFRKKFLVSCTCRWTLRIFAEQIVRTEFSTRLLFVSPGRLPKCNKRIYYSFRCLRRKYVSVDCSPWIRLRSKSSPLPPFLFYPGQFQSLRWDYFAVRCTKQSSNCTRYHRMKCISEAK